MEKAESLSAPEVDDRFQVLRLRTEYNATEDRLRLVCADAEDNVVAFWLTFRLVQRLVPALLKLIDLAPKQRSVDQSPVETRLAMQQMAQQAALAGQQSSEPVVMGSDTPCYLIDKVKIEPTLKVVTLKIDGVTEGHASLPLNATLLRQWMSALCEGYRVAGWPMAVWPDWLRSDSKPVDLSVTSKLLH